MSRQVRKLKKEIIDNYHPLGLLDKEEKIRKRYEKLAKSAYTSARAATKLYCIQCSGWEYKEAKECAINDCPLWIVNRKIFSKESKTMENKQS